MQQRINRRVKAPCTVACTAVHGRNGPQAGPQASPRVVHRPAHYSGASLGRRPISVAPLLSARIKSVCVSFLSLVHVLWQVYRFKYSRCNPTLLILMYNSSILAFLFFALAGRGTCNHFQDFAC